MLDCSTSLHPSSRRIVSESTVQYTNSCCLLLLTRWTNSIPINCATTGSTVISREEGAWLHCVHGHLRSSSSDPSFTPSRLPLDTVKGLDNEIAAKPSLFPFMNPLANTRLRYLVDLQFDQNKTFYLLQSFITPSWKCQWCSCLQVFLRPLAIDLFRNLLTTNRTITFYLEDTYDARPNTGSAGLLLATDRTT